MFDVEIILAVIVETSDILLINDISIQGMNEKHQLNNDNSIMWQRMH